MITFILLAAGAIVILAAVGIAFSANQRKRAGQSGKTVVAAEKSGGGRPVGGRSQGID